MYVCINELIIIEVARSEIMFMHETTRIVKLESQVSTKTYEALTSGHIPCV